MIIGSGGARAEVYAISAASAVVLGVVGYIYFRRVERTFADVI